MQYLPGDNTASNSYNNNFSQCVSFLSFSSSRLIRVYASVCSERLCRSIDRASWPLSNSKQTVTTWPWRSIPRVSQIFTNKRHESLEASWPVGQHMRQSARSVHSIRVNHRKVTFTLRNHLHVFLSAVLVICGRENGYDPSFSYELSQAIDTGSFWLF